MKTYGISRGRRRDVGYTPPPPEPPPKPATRAIDGRELADPSGLIGVDLYDTKTGYIWRAEKWELLREMLWLYVARPSEGVAPRWRALDDFEVVVP